ncbi:MAG: cytochrome C, partial [Candidatus Rokuibacteriota bacterium]
MLDIGRSVYARLGHARPTELWQPAREVYADLAWPPGSDVPASAPPGRRLYVRWCATCHGPDGRGNGPAAPSLIPRPRDFTRGLFKYKSTPADQPPTDD